ncbi:MAG TPA: hypothetical protein ENK41_01600 [Rhodobacteraceae bacterium]|nr:hypothetical protein [Paracoccaceae bacterium]
MPMAEIEFEGGPHWSARLMRTVRGSALWLGTLVFTALAVLAAVFFAMAALAGIVILAGAMALVWLIFRIAGSGGRSGDPLVLDARRGPHGWTVDGLGPFGSR